MLPFELINNQNLTIMNTYFNLSQDLDSDFKKLVLLLYSHCNYDKKRINPITFIEDCILEVAESKFIELYREFILDHNKKEKDGFVYVMQDYSGLYKIGYSQNPDERLKQLKTGNPKISMYNNYPANRLDEKLLHKLFEKKRDCGEWFNLRRIDLKWIDNYFINQNQ